MVAGFGNPANSYGSLKSPTLNPMETALASTLRTMLSSANGCRLDFDAEIAEARA